MRHTLPLLSIGVLIATPCVVAAQPPGRGGPGGSPMEMISQVFTQADANNDGSVTREELIAVMRLERGGNRQGRGGLPNGGRPGGNGNQQQGPQDQHGPPPRPGEVLPTFVLETIELKRSSEASANGIADRSRQATGDWRLAKILTDEQKLQLENQRPAGGEHGGPGNGRSQRPQ